MDGHPGAIAIQQDFDQGPHAARGAGATTGNPGLRWRRFDGGGGLAMQKAACARPIEPQQAYGLLDAASGIGLPAPGGGHGAAVRAAAAAALVATSSSKNRLRSSRPAAVIASRPPSWRSTIVTTRSTW